MARRVTPCPRNLDDVLRIAALGLSMDSLGLVFCSMLLFIGLELSLGLFSLFFGHWGMAAAFVATIFVGIGLRQAEMHDDQHFVPSMILFYLTKGDGWRFWRQVVYSSLVPERYEGHTAPEMPLMTIAGVGFVEVVALVMQLATRLLTRHVGWAGTCLVFGLPLGLLALSVRWARLDFERQRAARLYRAQVALLGEEEKR